MHASAKIWYIESPLWNAANGILARKILQGMQLIYCANPTSPETHKISLGSYTSIGVLIRVGGRYQQE